MSRYAALIQPKRLRETSQPGRDLELEILSDNSRIITSAAFRRLQTKAQVFSLEQNASVRTRLTHTLEVSMFGGLIARKVFTRLKNDGAIKEELRLPFIKTVENACLLHDIGNPPFGHLGEFAIRDWFDHKETDVKQIWRDMGVDQSAVDRYYRDFRWFDGNPQGFRIVTKLQWLKDSHGLNLTCTLLASIIKYLSSEPSTQHDPLRRKSGFFETERDLVATIWRNLDLRTEPDGSPSQRHPLVYLMEAADDIAFCLSDIEDALEKRIVSEWLLFDHMRDFVDQFIPGSTEESSDLVDLDVLASRDVGFIEFRIALTRYLVDTAARMFVERNDQILKGDFKQSLLDVDPRSEKALEGLKAFAQKYIFVSKEAVDIELSGFRVVQGLLDGFYRLLPLSKDEFQRLSPESDHQTAPSQRALERRLFSLLPNKHQLAYTRSRYIEHTS